MIDRKITDREIQQFLRCIIRQNVLLLRKYIPSSKLQLILRYYPHLSFQQHGRKYRIIASRFQLKEKRFRLYVLLSDLDTVKLIINAYNRLQTNCMPKNFFLQICFYFNKHRFYFPGINFFH
jgi:hypothetical protein